MTPEGARAKKKVLSSLDEILLQLAFEVGKLPCLVTVTSKLCNAICTLDLFKRRQN
jgi:hypothetical protein